MKKIRESITELNVANSNDVSKTKHDELRGIVEDLLPYAELEEEFGFDLSLFKKVLLGDKNGICFWSSNDNSPRPCGPYRMNMDLSNLRFYSRGEYWESVYYFKDYGKTWALTREELL